MTSKLHVVGKPFFLYHYNNDNRIILRLNLKSVIMWKNLQAAVSLMFVLAGDTLHNLYCNKHNWQHNCFYKGISEYQIWSSFLYCTALIVICICVPKLILCLLKIKDMLSSSIVICQSWTNYCLIINLFAFIAITSLFKVPKMLSSRGQHEPA